MTGISYLCTLLFAIVLVGRFAPGVFSRGSGLERRYLPYLVLELPVRSERVFSGALVEGEAGVPHDALMRKQGLEAGEYLRWLERWSWEGEHLTRRVRGREYEIYCVPAAGEVTQVPIPVGYDRYLRTAFGDYMQLPKEADRKPMHEAVFLDCANGYEKYKGRYYCVDKKRGKRRGLGSCILNMR